MNDYNPYRAPDSDFDSTANAPSGDASATFRDGLREPVPRNAFDGILRKAWSLSDDSGTILWIAVVLVMASFVSGRVDGVLAELGGSTPVLLLSFVISIFWIVIDIFLRMKLLILSLAKVRRESSMSPNTSPSTFQVGQGLLLSLPLVLSLSALSAGEIVGTEMPGSNAGSILAAIGFVMVLGAMLFNAVSFPAYLFILDQKCSAWDGLRRAAKLIRPNLLGWALFGFVIVPVVFVAGLLVCGVGAIVSIALIHVALAVAYDRAAEPVRCYLPEEKRAALAGSSSRTAHTPTDRFEE